MVPDPLFRPPLPVETSPIALNRDVSDAALALILIVPAYFLGTFPSALLMARSGGHDVLSEGSGNPGASNVARLMGWKAGLLVLGADFAKGAIASGVGLAVAGRGGAFALGIAAVIGHMFPATRRFKGGKGVATAGGMLIVLYPWIVLVLALVWFLVARVLKLASVASLLCAVLFPVLVWVGGYGTAEIVAIAALAVVVIARHAANVRRLFQGRELRTGDGDASADPQG
jgi:acyl phosphate:glycerol-3-phosphate acyltransferase